MCSLGTREVAAVDTISLLLEHVNTASSQSSCYSQAGPTSVGSLNLSHHTPSVGPLAGMLARHSPWVSVDDLDWVLKLFPLDSVLEGYSLYAATLC